jgi:hypothetical protein
MIDHDETELLEAFEQGQLKSVITKSELAKFKAAARATAGGTSATVRSSCCKHVMPARDHTT